MRILNVTAQKPDSTGSGVYLSELIRGFHKMGHTQALLAGVYEEDKIELPEEINKYPVYFRTEKLPFPIAGMSDEMPYESTRYCDMTQEMTEQFRIAYTEKITETLSDFAPDIILCHHLYFITSLVKELAGNVPVYAVCHGSDLRQIKKNPWQREYIKQMIPKLDGIFALHKEQKQDICHFFGCPENLVDVIGTGYNSDVFYETKKPQKENNKEIRLVFVGKVSEKKGVMSLLESTHLLNTTNYQYNLTLVGGAGNQQEYKKIQKLAKTAGIPVEFVGRLEQKEVSVVMNDSDVFILPSFYEGLPLVVIEAMACGLKVVCTDLPGIRPWLDGTVENHNVMFVQPPKMENEDEPVKETLPEFEQQLAYAMEQVAKEILAERNGEKKRSKPNLSRVSWDGLCRLILEITKA